MSQVDPDAGSQAADTAPGEAPSDRGKARRDIQTYLIGLALASGLTLASFYVLKTDLVWAPAIPVALTVFAIAQMGVHLVFFLHITTGPESTNNVLALAFGVLIVLLVMGGSLFIMSHLDHNMMPMDRLMQMQR